MVNYCYSVQDGVQLDLLCLSGTLRICFRGTFYNIPITVWLPSNYPLNAPTVIVVPTQNMCVRPSRNVDPAGRVYLPFLADWPQRTDSTLIMLAELLIELFEACPPVYANPSSAANNNNSPAQSTTPSTSNNMGINSNLSTSVNFNNSSNSRVPVNYNLSSSGILPTNISNFSSNTPGAQSVLPPPRNTNYQSNYIHIQNQKLPSPVALSLPDTTEFNLRQKAFTLVSNRTAEYMATAPAEIDRLLAINRQLLESSQKFDRFHAMYVDIRAHMTQQNEQMVETSAKLDKSLAELASAPDVDVDTLTCARPEQQQLLELTAHSHALEDMLYYISAAFGKSQSDPNLFIKVHLVNTEHSVNRTRPIYEAGPC